jgi:subtilase family serine protease
VDDAEQNNEASLIVESALALYPDLEITGLAAVPTDIQTGDGILLTYRVDNIGTGYAPISYVQKIELINSDTNQLLLAQTLIQDPALPGLLDPGQGHDRQFTLTVPDGSASVGQLEISVVVDPFDDIYEYNASGGAEDNNEASTVVTATLAAYPDLAVVEVDAPALVIGDPPAVTVSWIVENQGLQVTEVDRWHDAVIVSENDVAGDGDDIELARYLNEGTLNQGENYTRSETFLLPAEFIGRYHLFVRTDADNVVFEDGAESNNAAESSQVFDVMLIPYADLVVTDLQVPQSGFSGQSLAVTWTVANDGIGTTNKGSWTDSIWLTEDPSALPSSGVLGRFSHYGHLEVDGSYTRTGHVILPDGLEGNYYIVVGTGVPFGPFEFIYGDNNHASAALQVQLTSPPDLVVSDIVAPQTAEEGTLVDISWTVSNQGTGPAQGIWEDKVYLQRASDPTGPHLEIGCFTYEGVLEAGMSYTRWETFTLPEHIHDLYQVVVTTNHDREEGLYEHGAEDNNTTVDDQALAVSIKPRPDLQVASVSMPNEADPGGTFSVEYVIINQGTAATDVAHWYDNVYLSLDNEVSYDDILVDSVRNQSALAPGESYLSMSASVAVPLRFRGEVYILVFADANGGMDEWPNENNNILATPIYVEPLPLPDLVTGEVVCPQQAVEGAQIEVRYTVTNLGSGQTLVPTWTDTVWLTQDKNRPHPGLGDTLLATVEHSGSLPVGAGYDQTLIVTLPQGLASGTYYVMPWSDPYDVVLEDTLAVNVNPDDPHEINNNNYKARAIDILGTAWVPDLVVTEVRVDPQAMGGDQYTVTWTVENQGTGPAEPAGWTDRIHLYTELNEEPWFDNTLVLAEVTHDDVLVAGAGYTKTITVTLSPSAVGEHVLVYTDALVMSEGMEEPQDRVTESNELNNQLVVDTDVRPVPADLVVTDVLLQPENLSGESTVIQYTVTNVGEYAVWSGTEYWVDSVWISADPQWKWGRGSYVGKYVHSNENPLQPGESYTATVEGNLPVGIGGDYFIYVHMDTHGGNDPEDEKGGTLRKDWWPADLGFNARWLEHFKSGAFEDPYNNLNPEPMTVTYYEPDLVVTDLTLPADAMSGQTIPVTFTVSNLGTRDTREDKWSDRVFLSRDPSLDGRDLFLGQFDREEILAIGDSYTATVEVRLPDGIEGDFYVLAFADSPAVRTPHSGSLSDIGFGLPGV